MSYILDALRKADAEREQGRVPGLHSHLGQAPAESAASPAVSPTTRSSWPVMVGAGLAGGLLAAIVLWWTLRANAPAAPPAAVAVLPASTMASEAPSALNESMAPSPETARPVVQPVPAPDLPLPQAAAPPRPSPPPPAAKVAAQDAQPATPLDGLPDQVRRSLPPLVFGGAMHSDNAASRMLVINNNVYREGDEPAPGLVLEEIRLKSAVFRFQGQRFSVNY
ncbi:general secretion pathway protein GspB [Aquabacterium sp. A3]|uniref:general secretion pathway protein GspB n=1 Tax=Aquabacterium sp. A3 TaxID=3132829 RepID=UPI0031194818